jgi:hypothetical protein
MVSISELKQLKDYYKEKVQYLFDLLKNESYYCEDEKKFKHSLYMKEIKSLEKSIDEITKEVRELEKSEKKPELPKKVERKYTPYRVKIKKSSKTKVKTSKSKSPTLAEKIEDIRVTFPKMVKEYSSKMKTKERKVSKTNVKKSSKSRSRSKSQSRYGSK